MIRHTVLTLVLALGALPTTVIAQEVPSHIACLTNAEMTARFNTGETDRLPNYSQGAGARVQRQYPNTALIGQAKYINWDGKSLGLCLYSNHVGVVASFALRGALADADDEACDDGSCQNNAYWRSEWAESREEDDRPNREQIYVCMNDLGQAAIPSTDCYFNRPE